MKLVIVTTALLGAANASMNSLLANIENVIKAQNITRGNGRAPVGGAREFKGSVANAFEPMNGYGCWCYLDDTWRDANQVLINRPAILAHGQVVDDLDASCRDLINSYKCIEMDAEANGITDCDAQAVDYIPYNFLGGQDINVECANSNSGNECAANACIVEGAFTLKYIAYVGDLAPSLTTHPDFNPDHVHNNNAFSAGTFDPEVSCPGIPNPVGSDKECCGEFALLTRHPYRLYSGFTTRSCCQNTVINNELTQCCPTESSSPGPLDINETC